MLLEFWQLLKEQKVAAHRSVDGKIFTMAQFRNLFNTSRRPGVGLDTVVSHFRTDSSCPSHFIVMCKGRFFKIDALSGHQGILTAPELEALYEQILAKCSSPGEAVAALTCDNRDQWAKVSTTHRNYFRHFLKISVA
jgi:carnitine O-octanoyltransferase